MISLIFDIIIYKKFVKVFQNVITNIHTLQQNKSFETFIEGLIVTQSGPRENKL